jgi:magnesium transporter
MKENSPKYSRKQGLPPGSLVHTGIAYESKIHIQLISYDDESFTITESNDINSILPKLNPEKVNWIKITGLHDINQIDKLGIHFSLHPLMLEDVLNTHHLPKTEDYENEIFLTLKELSITTKNNIIEKRQISFILGNSYLISFEEQKSDIFLPIIERIKTKKGKLRMMQNDYLFYALTDIIIDNYLKIVDDMDDDMEQIEEELLNEKSKLVLKKILHKRKQQLSMKKSVNPLLDEIRKLHHSESTLINPKTYIYFQDIIDHLQQVNQNLESFREMVSNLTELYLANNDVQMNDVMKRLTVVSTIFIPLTFIVGLYGMNFKNFPELEWKYGYFISWGIMITISIGMIIYLKKRKWV